MIADFIVPAILGKRYPNYSHLYAAISELGTKKSPVRKELSIWLIILGVLFLLFGIGQSVQFTRHTIFHWMYLWGIAAFGVGAGIIAGIFPEDAAGTTETSSGKVHGIFAGLGFLFLLLNPLWALWIFEFSALKTLNLMSFGVAGSFFILFILSKGKRGIFGMSGLWQRFYLLAAYCMLLMNFITSNSA